MIYAWKHLCKSELKGKFDCKNQFQNHKLLFLESSRINSGGKINSTLEKQNMSKSSTFLKSVLAPPKVDPNMPTSLQSILTFGDKNEKERM